MKRYVCLLGVISLVALIGCKDVTSDDEISTEEVLKEPVTVSIDSTETNRLSRREIAISWADDYDDIVEEYIIMWRDVENGQGIGNWYTLETIKSDRKVDSVQLQYVDELADNEPKQYEYRVDVKLSNEETYKAGTGKAVFGSNVMVCIDPGHYDIAREVAEADEYHYVEGNFVLKIALELRNVLKDKYGIDSYLTRDCGSITLDGYSDDELDSKHVSLRGEYASKEDSDLFISLHTNSNEEEANGCPTYFQPIEINKPIIIANLVACESEVAIDVANAIGNNLANTNFELGLSVSNEFDNVEMNAIDEWTKSYNDGLNKVGTVVCRTGSKGKDYYGILRGASSVNIPGIIVEHGFHSVQEVRKSSCENELAILWAEADAKGIAKGFGFVE